MEKAWVTMEVIGVVVVLSAASIMRNNLKMILYCCFSVKLRWIVI